jgi:transposase
MARPPFATLTSSQKILGTNEAICRFVFLFARQVCGRVCSNLGSWKRTNCHGFDSYRLRSGRAIRHRKPAFSAFLYRYRKMVKRFFNKLKHHRAVATLYDKTPEKFLASVKLASARTWMRVNESMAQFTHSERARKMFRHASLRAKISEDRRSSLSRVR